MTTTGELRAIVEELELVDIGEAASYLGEESIAAEDAVSSDGGAFAARFSHLATDDCPSSQRR